MEAARQSLGEVDAAGDCGMKIITVTASIDPDHLAYFQDTCTRGNVTSDFYSNSGFNIGLRDSYQKLYEEYRSTKDIIVFMHDDVEVFTSNWVEAIAKIFHESPETAIVGLGGATGIGVRDIYKTPYHITQLQRTNYASNQRDWQIHGAHETGVRDVAVADGFFMAVRTSFLDEVKGWSWFPHSFHCYDTAMCLQAIRHGWKVQTIGLDCHHHGGGTSTKPEYEKWCKENGTDMAKEHWAPHIWMYDEFRDLLPYEVTK